MSDKPFSFDSALEALLKAGMGVIAVKGMGLGIAGAFIWAGVNWFISEGHKERDQLRRQYWHIHLLPPLHPPTSHQEEWRFFDSEDAARQFYTALQNEGTSWRFSLYPPTA